MTDLAPYLTPPSDGSSPITHLSDYLLSLVLGHVCSSTYFERGSPLSVSRRWQAIGTPIFEKSLVMVFAPQARALLRHVARTRPAGEKLLVHELLIQDFPRPPGAPRVLPERHPWMYDDHYDAICGGDEDQQWEDEYGDNMNLNLLLKVFETIAGVKILTVENLWRILGTFAYQPLKTYV